MHSIRYDGVFSDWSEALPLGNGQFGAMAWWDGQLHFSMNQYEVYYRKLSGCRRSARPRDFHRMGGRSYDEMKALAAASGRRMAGGEAELYGDTLGGFYRDYGKNPGGESQYPSGELLLEPAEGLRAPENSRLRLDIENARVEWENHCGGDSLTASTWVASDEDLLVSQVGGSPGSLRAVTLSWPRRRLLRADVRLGHIGGSLIYYVARFYPDGPEHPFEAVGMTRVVGAEGTVRVRGDTVRLELPADCGPVRLVTTVVPACPAAEVGRRLASAVGRLPELEAAHRGRWRQFWSRSSVRLPDKMLETLWYMGLYLLGSSSGKDGPVPAQACGLNGLWDIRQPTRWGSMWYWDVNIESAFWPVYTANHLELAEGFNAALLAHLPDAEKMAEEFYGLEGYAADYPHPLYHCILPWCAQFLWRYYRCGMDREFLHRTAYPVFRKMLRFIAGLAQKGPDGRYHFIPDISPEQGPLTCDSTITLASVRYLLRAAVAANRVLGEDPADAREWKRLLAGLPVYPTARTDRYGRIFRDSPRTPAATHLRHPSVLMPVFPAEEIGLSSRARRRETALHTLRFAADHTEYGTFQFGWLACVAARLGRGDLAVQLLYEKGVDLSMRPNGLFAEETERWIQYCGINNPALYHPPMMEASGGAAAAVNEMLMQNDHGVIRIFPALPAGVREPETDPARYAHEMLDAPAPSGSWKDCCFSRFLAEGGFEVSAERRGGKTAEVQIVSRHGGMVRLANSAGVWEADVSVREEGSQSAVPFIQKNGVLSFRTRPGRGYRIENGAPAPAAPPAEEDGEGKRAPLCRRAFTGRRVFLGKDRETELARILDGFTFDYCEGNCRRSPVSIYRLDLGMGGPKDYASALPRQTHADRQLGQNFRPVTPDMHFTPENGLGWKTAGRLEGVDRGGPDALRRDGIRSTDAASLVLELPRGKYDVLVLAGDPAAACWPEAAVGEGAAWHTPRPLRPGEYAARVFPVVRERDGYLRIALRGRSQYPWAVSAVIVNKQYGML